MLDILIPTFGRAYKLEQVAANVAANTQVPHNLWFCLEADDAESVSVTRSLGRVPIINSRTRSYSGAINSGYQETSEPYLFIGADDLEFTPGWDTTCISRVTGNIQVVGTNDMYNPSVLSGIHATHFLVDRSYLDITGGVADEGPGSCLWEGYTHNYCDTEFIATARHRGVFAPCLAAVVKHLHWSIGYGNPDATNERANASFWEDDAKYNARSHLWT